MIKHYRNTFIFLNFCLLSLTAGAQAPDKLLDNITLRFKNYVSDYPWEEIYVHTDRQDYIAGENVWFALYLVDRQSLKLSGISKIGYLEVFNSENRPVAGKRIKMENGQGSGQVILPDTLSSGTYTLRAYTNWMKNFLPENCFSMTINVYNAVSNSRFTGTARESSHLRHTLSSGQVPYQSTGYVVDIDNSDAESAIINIGTTRDLRNREGSLVYLFIETRGNINFSGSVNLTSNKTTVPVPRYYFMPGINHITIFNGQGKPVSENYMLTKPVSADPVEIISPADIKAREHVSLDIAVKVGDSGKADSSALSISIVPVTGRNFPGIGNYLIFGSEFGIPPEQVQTPDQGSLSGESYENLLPSLKSIWIDWSKILPDKKPAIRYQRESEEHFIYGRLINQSSGLSDTGKYLFLSIPGKNAYFQYSLTDMNGDFFFRVPVDDYYRDLIIQPEKVDANDVIKAESSFSEKYPSQISDEDSLTGKPPENISKMKVNYQIEKIYKTEITAAKSKPPEYEATSRRFYGKPDVELKMDDYIKLPVMQEVFFELLPGVTLKSRKSGYEMIVTDPVEYKPFEVPPTLFIDGVVINDAAVIANLDPELVDRIDAVRERYFVGDYMFYGIVNVITRAGNFSNVTLPDYAVRIPYRVIDTEAPFISPEYSTTEMKKSRIPDFRNSLYWNPSVKTGGDGKAEVGFWTSDFATDYEIIVQGMSQGGRPFYSRKIITVKR